MLSKVPQQAPDGTPTWSLGLLAAEPPLREPPPGCDVVQTGKLKGPKTARRMIGGKHLMMGELEPHGLAIGTAVKRQLRALIPPMTAKIIFRALLGVVLFFCGIVFGVWLIIRFRRRIQDGDA